MKIYIDRTTERVVLQPSFCTYEIEVSDDFNITKTIAVAEGEKQKTNYLGQLLYKTNEQEAGIFDETIEAKTVTKTEEKQTPNTYYDEDGAEHTEIITVNEPIEWIDNAPVMIPNVVEKVISFNQCASEFTALEVIQAKYQSVLDNSACDYILADMFLNEDDVDVTDVLHSANTGVGVLQLLPQGQAKTKPLQLETAAATFQLLDFTADDGVTIYIDDVQFNGTTLALPAAVDTVVVTFKNNTDKLRSVRNYAIGY